MNLLKTPSGKWDSRVAFSPREVCEMLGLARSTLSEYYKTGKLKVSQYGKHYRILRHDLEEFMEEARDKGKVI